MQNIEIGLLFVLIGGIIGVITFFIGQKTAAKKDGVEFGTFQAELKKDIEYIKRDVKEIKDSMGDNRREIYASIRSLHKRINDHLRTEHGQTVTDYDE